jgi:hypothetical protein
MKAFFKIVANFLLNIGQQMAKLFSWLRDTGRIYSASLRIKKTSLPNSSNQRSKNTTAEFFRYDDILLKIFIDVAQTSEYVKVVKNGQATAEQCMEAWEAIVKRNADVTGNMGYNGYLNETFVYADMLSEYLFMRAALTKLLYVIDYPLIQEVRDKGYSIDLGEQDDTAQARSQKYADSLYATSRQVDNIATRIKMHYNKMALNTVDKSEGGGFDETIANLNMAIGFVETDNITLARYNEYCKMIKKRAAKSKDNGGNK